MTMAATTEEITTLLTQWRDGRDDAGDKLIASLYGELRRLAEHYMSSERAGHTLQATALVNELYLRLFGGQPIRFQDRAHFFAIAAQQMRRVLVDHARSHHAEKRGGSRPVISLDEAGEPAAADNQNILAIHQALEELEKLDSRSAKAVELRFFGGLTESEAAEVLGISVATLKRDWSFGRAWLLSRLDPAG